MALNAKRIEKPFRKLRKLLKNIPKQPEPDQVHDLRTNTRALEAMATALSLDSQSAVKKLLKDLTRIRKRAGKVRDLDVLTGYAATLQMDGERDCSVRLLEYLGAQRRKKAKKLHLAAASNGRATRGKLRRTLARFEQQLCQNDDPACDTGQASARATAAALQLEKQLVEPARLDRRNLHGYRLKVKELRNVLRMAEEANHLDFVEVLGKVKDAIGEWHDWEELAAIAGNVLDHGRRCQLTRELKRICADKFDHALSMTENMRRKYFRLTRGKNSRGLKPVEPVWTATTAIAA